MYRSFLGNKNLNKIKLLLSMKFLGCTAEVNASGNQSETFEICAMIRNANNLE